MAKWQSKLLETEKDLGGGRTKWGRTGRIPLNDAAMAHPYAAEALKEGIWTPADPKAIDNAKKRIAEKMEVEVKAGRLYNR